MLTVPKDEFLRRFGVFSYESGTQLREEVLSWIAETARYADRTAAEGDVSSLQVVAYGSIRCRNRVFVLRRRSNDRSDISDRFALALGGHVDDTDDVGLGGPVFGALCRELGEELRTPDVTLIQHRGFVYDSQTVGSSIHLCSYYEVWVRSEDVHVRETGPQGEFRSRRGKGKSGTFMDLTDVPPLYPQLDPWSRILAASHFCCVPKSYLASVQTTLPYVPVAA